MTMTPSSRSIGGWRRHAVDGAKAIDVRDVMDAKKKPDRMYRLVSAPDIAGEPTLTVPFAVTTALRAKGVHVADENGVLGTWNIWRTVVGRGMVPARASTATDIVLALANRVGPVVLGLHWLSGCDDVDTRTGIMRYEGARAGGHCVALIGCKDKSLVRVVNVWGVGWGQLGRAWLSVDALEDILDDGGEACVLLSENEI
jgi:hypothetical protein